MKTTAQKLYEIARLRTLLLESRIDFLRQKYIPLLGMAIEQASNATYSSAFGDTKKFDFPREWVDHAENLYFHKLGPTMGAKMTEAEKAKLKQEAFGEYAFDRIVEADPDIHKKNAQWLLNTILRGGSMLEDLEKATNYLTIFERVKRMLPQEQRDLNKYKSFADLYVAIKDKEQEMSKREADRAQEVAMHEQARIILNDSKYKVVVPLTQAASCHFGMNTQWCTAAARGNQFESYNKEGPLYIILEKATNHRWQYHAETGQFTNENDQLQDVQVFMKAHPDVANAILAELPKPIGSIREYPLFRNDESLYAQTSIWNEWKKTSRVLQLRVVNNQFRGKIRDEIGFRPEEIAHLLNHFQVEGDPEDKGFSGASKYNLYYLPVVGDLGFEDMRWQTLPEASQPIMELADGWKWRAVKTAFGYDLILVPEAYDPKWRLAQEGKNLGYACRATVELKGVFSIIDIPVFGNPSTWDASYKSVASTKASVLGKQIVDLVLGVKNIRSWEDTVVFQPRMLDEEQAKRLVAEKPQMADLQTLFKAKGVTPVLKRKVLKLMDENYVPHTNEWFSKDSLILYKWNNIEECIDDLGTDEGKNFYKNYIEDGTSIEYYPEDVDRYQRDEFISFLAKKHQDVLTRLGHYLADSYASEIEDIFGEQDDEDSETFDPSSEDDISQLLNDIDDGDLERAMLNAIATGYETGAQDEAFEIFKKEINGNPYLHFWRESVLDKKTGEWQKLKKPKWTDDFAYDVPVIFVVPLKLIVPLLDEDNISEIEREGWFDLLDDAKLNMEQPYNGFSNYDDDSANDRFLEELEDFLPEAEATP